SGVPFPPVLSPRPILLENGRTQCRAVCQSGSRGPRNNSYLDTIWSRNRTVGGAPLQRRVVWLLESLGLHARNVAASNLIFFRSRDAAGSQFRRFATLCWPVHERIIQIVRPRLVIVYGNSGVSPFSYLLNEYKTAGGRDLLLGPRRLEMSQFRCARSLS